MRAISGLKIDFDSGEGEVSLPSKFLEEGATFRQDVLRDWIAVLESLRDEAANEVFAQFKGVDVAQVVIDREIEEESIEKESNAFALGIVGKTIAAVEKGESGATVLSFSDGTANALYPTYRKGTPRVFVSHELSADNSAE